MAVLYGLLCLGLTSYGQSQQSANAAVPSEAKHDIVSNHADDSWRSVLYPEDWSPGYTVDGKFLHDFSYAGYHYGEKALPDTNAMPAINVTQSPYLVDNTGKADVTAKLQAIIDQLPPEGGVIYLPTGTYRVSPQGNNQGALVIERSNIVIRGDGPGKTFIFNDASEMHYKHVFKIAPKTNVSWNINGEHTRAWRISQDYPKPSKQIRLDDIAGLEVGDKIIIRNDLTQHMIDLVGMTGHWTPTQSPNRTLAYYRIIRSIDPATKTITLDIPIRGFLFQADNARVLPLTGEMLSEIGLEGFSIGMREHTGEGYKEEDYKIPGTVGHASYLSSAIHMTHTENSWIKEVHSFHPDVNETDYHLRSNGIKLIRSRLVTVQGCDLRLPQYRGGGGNGYLYTHNGQDNLIRDSYAESGRHNYDVGTMHATGNVTTNCTTTKGRLASDFHMFFSIGNLFDTMTCDVDSLEARAMRPWGYPVHGTTASQCVFWNTKGLNYPADRPNVIVQSHQHGDGYVIGTSGPAYLVDSTDHVEGVGKGDTLTPHSLYQDQLARRLQSK
ncbi:hypothetical protein H5P30_00930 [Puniceicoccus vermicola]|uniref:Rhamnogalacturonase A/B/Epimerase-like pectate lyase domain-containing protein n=2 Tax=Puniceicoccus vermicola TaxID=388746 RepID=A0A7X1AUN5_9BACT|nr:hypothetical protein [Puniceicoccus vermicola]